MSTNKINRKSVKELRMVMLCQKSPKDFGLGILWIVFHKALGITVHEFLTRR